MDGRGIAAALMLGASGVQMGTAFVACPETAVNPAYVKRLLAANLGDAILTDVDFRQGGSIASKQACQSSRAVPRPSPSVSRTALDDPQSSQGCVRDKQRRVLPDVCRSGRDPRARCPLLSSSERSWPKQGSSCHAITQTIRASEHGRTNDRMNEWWRIKTRFAARARATGSENICNNACNKRRKI